MSDDNSQPKYLEDITSKREETKKRVLEQIAQERNEKDTISRFGYFSIPYPAIVGDEAYSQNQEYQNHKVVDHKVIIEKRGIFTRPGKQGKTNDVYFAPIEPLPDDKIELFKQLNKSENERYLQSIKDKKGKSTTIPFKPPGSGKLKGYYDEEHEPNDGLLFSEPDKKRFIKEGKVVTEKRGIYTGATKVNTSLPSDFFSYPQRDDSYQEILKKKAIDDFENKMKGVKERKENKNFKKPFQPAALMKCEPFANNEKTYGMYTQDEIEERMKEYKEWKKNGRGKYKKILPEGSVKHLKAFSPAKLVSTGRDALFNDDLYKIPDREDLVNAMKEKNKSGGGENEKEMSIREKMAEMNKNKRVPFTYNKLMKISTFSPPITSFSVNLKREFPSIKFH